jgi:hypothetical protein
MLDAVQKSCFRHIITGDENWFYLEYQHASQESVPAMKSLKG